MLSNPLDATGACAAEDMSDPAFVGDLLERGLESGEFPVPQLPEAAMRVVRAWESSNAAQLSEIIKADPALARYVLRIAASAPHRPATPIVSLPHAVAWLGFDEVANMAFTLSLQPTMLDVPGHHVKARRLWRHSLASALWSRQLALALERDRGVCYLCGLLHAIGKGVTLSVSHALARQFGKTLGARDLDLLIERFHREVTARVVTAWGLP
ncbi:MAG TPA: HDOD domain-containing protein, partial [Steroidobacteraceae bacterium]|nr:HDOD domain-containing protein [Steroidobacteraceae bacterium]